MSGVVLDVPAGSTTHRSFLRILLAVFLGYACALVTFILAALPLLFLWVYPSPWVPPGPFPIDGAWSLGADLVVAAVIVFWAAWWVRGMVARAVRGPVSFGVVALAVALIGYVPSILLGAPGLTWSIFVQPVVTTWVIRRYAIGTTLPFPAPSRRLGLALGIVGFAVLGSYFVYHPLITTGVSTYADFTLKNADWARMTILSVDGGVVRPGNARGYGHPLKFPYTLGSRDRLDVYVTGRPCVTYDVVITFSVLGRTSAQRFTVTPDAPGNGAFTDLPIGAGCNE
jgi:hypothetical protein